METNFKGRLRNTNLSPSHAFMPLFEAVINSIHAISDAKISPSKGEIRIEIIRQSDEQFNLSPDPDIDARQNLPVTFNIFDNGIGFTDENMTSFSVLDSEHKKERGGRGVGRLLWLKEFQTVKIKSCFAKEGKMYVRSFFFDENNEVNHHNLLEAPKNSTSYTQVTLENVYEKFQKSLNKRINTIAREIFEHCLGYYLVGKGVPNILIKDGDNCISLNDIYAENLSNSIKTEEIEIKNQIFRLVHVRLRTISIDPKVYYCVNQRSVRPLNLATRIAGLFNSLEDEFGTFHYACYVTSPFLDERLYSDRTGFDIQKEDEENIFQEQNLSFATIDFNILQRIEAYLEPCLEKSRGESYNRVVKFIENKAPHYRPLLKRIPKERLYLSISSSEQDIELALHREKSKIEEEFLVEERNINNKLDRDDYTEEEFNNDLAIISDIKQSDLVQYVTHRNYILKILKKLIEKIGNGHYVREEMLHNLIMPMGKESNDLLPDESNLWVIDEKLAFHHFLSSDKTIASMTFTDSNSRKEPDLLKFDIFNTPTWVSDSHSSVVSAITIVEFKRPMRNDMKENENDPIMQMREYLKLIRKGKVSLPNGRPIYNSETIPGFCYAICDLTPSMIEICEDHELQPTYDKMGYFGYHKNNSMYIEVLSYDKLLKDALQRNQAFFQKLGLSSII